MARCAQTGDLRCRATGERRENLPKKSNVLEKQLRLIADIRRSISAQKRWAILSRSMHESPELRLPLPGQLPFSWRGLFQSELHRELSKPSDARDPRARIQRNARGVGPALVLFLPAH